MANRTSIWIWLLAPVLATVAVVVMFPVWACACSKSTKGTHCLTNLKQTSLAMVMYREDHDGYMPPAEWNPTVAPYLKSARSEALFCPGTDEGAGKTSFALRSALVGKSLAMLPEEDGYETLMLFEVGSLGSNVVAEPAAMPKPGRHKGKNNTAYANGTARRGVRRDFR